MCVSEPIEGKHSIKGDRVKTNYKDFMQYSDGSDQFLSANEKKVTYISRI